MGESDPIRPPAAALQQTLCPRVLRPGLSRPIAGLGTVQPRQHRPGSQTGKQTTTGSPLAAAARPL